MEPDTSIEVSHSSEHICAIMSKESEAAKAKKGVGKEKARSKEELASKSKNNDVAKDATKKESKENKSNNEVKESKAVSKESKSNEVKESKESKSNEVKESREASSKSNEVATSATNGSKEKSVKLIYFDGKGRAELSRLVLAAAKLDFQDERIDGDAWSQLKPNTPMNQLPILEYEGEIISQSLSIARFLARNNELYGQTALQAAHIDMVVDYVADFNTKWMSVFRASYSPSYQLELISDILSDFVPRFLRNLEQLLASRGGKFFAGQTMSLADLAVFDALFAMTDETDPFYSELPIDPVLRLGLLEQFPLLTDLVARVLENEGINQWVQNRPRGLF